MKRSLIKHVFIYVRTYVHAYRYVHMYVTLLMILYLHLPVFVLVLAMCGSQSVLWRISWPSVCICLPWSHYSTRHPPTCWSMSWHSSQRYVCTTPTYIHTHIHTYIYKTVVICICALRIHTYVLYGIHTYVCIIRTHASVDVLHCVFMYVHMLLYEYMHVYVRMFVLEECRALWGKPECPSPP